MGWASAGNYFEPVADALIETGADDDTKYKVCKALISALQDGDWDTASESLGLYSKDEAIVKAFRECNVVIACGAEDIVGDHWKYCEEERNHSGKHRDWDGTEF
jgi:hypothetical protein